MTVIARCSNLLTAHPASVGETYTGHLRFAWHFGATMVAGGLACMVHGLLPFCLATSASRRVRALHATLTRHPGRRVPTQADLNGQDIARDIAAFTFSI